MKVLVLGITGMLGYSIYSNLSENKSLNVYGTLRNISGKDDYFKGLTENLVQGVNIYDFDSVISSINNIKPDVVVNCIGLIKQHDVSKLHTEAIYVNALLPHKLAKLCSTSGAKLIHFSTDCVFTGDIGNYSEESKPDALDLYGSSKRLGEVDYGGHLTLRTSIIGHELTSNVSLVDWFLSQNGSVKGFTKAIFSGLPTAYIAKLLIDRILPNTDISGLYHLSVNPIDKFTLLSLISDIYGHNIEIYPSETFKIDRSLNSSKLRKELALNTPAWPELIEYMNMDYKKRYSL
ncbi:SDR family NAD(P)-dependent oxidoreductase [Pseudoalteromonas sp. JC28]|uniref:dTDP-4-dehydrorhamnose reductase family protein n=1 Tax=Pseudoalteromonas sp. JC28 TaxID=2267617 RepID=UPI0015734CED|nr:SDR family oxidoreductase [Pseudoalteromonas sp. JC28]NSY35193.1 SDR family NAD(P)-dependent oxidoreductase [Pseudoalteromonas sp. JC28]